MDHFGLAPHLTAIVGATLDERTLSAKSDIVAEALRRLVGIRRRCRAGPFSWATAITTSRAVPSTASP